MFIPTFFTIAAAIISLFTLVNTHPTNAKLVIAEPRSLLGRQYRNVRVRRSITTAGLSPRQIDVVLQSAEPVTRSDRFHSIQRRRTEFVAHGEPLPDHGVNLLSNQSFGSRPALQTPIPAPSPSQTSSHPDKPNSTSPVKNRKYFKPPSERLRVSGKSVRVIKG